MPAPNRAPASSSEWSARMWGWSEANATLRNYFLPATSGQVTSDLRRNWVPATDGCRVSNNCYCFHVHGSLDKHENPNGAERCELWLGGKEPWVGNCTAVERPVPNAPAPVLDWMGRQNLNYPTETDPACRAACFTGRDLVSSCLFGHMSPAKIFFTITAARAAGVTHIVEEGREGGLTAYLYAMHGFRVTSVEYLPLDTVSKALLQQAPSVVQLDGDGQKLIPQLLSGISDEEASRTAVIFDGEKRLGAYKTFKKVRAKVALAVFDDSNQGVGSAKFLETVRRDEVTWPAKYAKLYHNLWYQQKSVYRVDDWQRFRRVQRMPAEVRGQHPDDFVYYHNFKHFHWAEYLMVKGGGWV